MGYYPIVLEMKNRPVLVVGGGSVALRKIESLIEAGASVSVIAPQVCEGIGRLAECGRIMLNSRAYSKGDVNGYSLVIAATDERAVNLEVSKNAQDAGIPVNVVDDPELCTFIAPAVLRRGNLMVSITTAGSAPALSKRVREIVESCLGDEYGVLSDIMAEVRIRAKRELSDLASRERVYQRILDSSILDIIRDGRIDDARNLAFSILREETIQ